MDKNIKKLVSAILATSFFTESCVSGYYFDIPADDLNLFIRNSNTTFDGIAIPIQVSFSKDDISYIIFLDKLASDILSNSSIAKEFAENPKQYIQRNGFEIDDVLIDHKLTKMILAFADDRISNAIKNQDVSEYLSLMIEKGIVDDLFEKGLNNISLNSPLTVNFSDLIKNNDNEDGALFIPVVVVGVAIAVWAAFVEHALVFNAAAFATVFTAVAAVNTITTGKIKRFYQTLLNSRLVEVYAIKSKEIDNIYLICDQIIDESVNIVLSKLQAQYPQKFENVDTSKLKTQILYNLNQVLDNYEED